MRLTIAILTFGLLTGCVEFHEAVDADSEVCVETAEDTLTVQLSHQCTASSQMNQEFTCEAEFVDGEIVVTSLFTYETKGNSTTLDCGIITTECEVDLPEDGTWTVSHGDQAFEIELTDGTLSSTETCLPQ